MRDSILRISVRDVDGLGILCKPHWWFYLEGDIPFRYSNFTISLIVHIICTNVSVLSAEGKKNYHRLQSMMMQIAHMGLSVCGSLFPGSNGGGVMKYARRNRMLPFGMIFEYSGSHINELFKPIAFNLF